MVKRGFPSVFEHDKILHVPAIGKSFSPVCGKPLSSLVMDVPATGEALASDAPSSSTVPSTPVEGFSSATWQSQLFSRVNDFVDTYARDQLRQRQFKKAIIDVLYAMTDVLKSSEACPDFLADGDFSNSSNGDGAFSVHSPVISPSIMDAIHLFLFSMVLLSLSPMFSLHL
uniref:Uncharacterized protein n=1 Tax=Cannabis sativa TaxID=3483 RepID=A0A803PUD2_CANSA